MSARLDLALGLVVFVIWGLGFGWPFENLLLDLVGFLGIFRWIWLIFTKSVFGFGLVFEPARCDFADFRTAASESPARHRLGGRQTKGMDSLLNVPKLGHSKFFKTNSLQCHQPSETPPLALPGLSNLPMAKKLGCMARYTHTQPQQKFHTH